MGLSLSKTPGGDTSPSSCWPDLPHEIAGLVLSHLASHEDRLSFAAVCPQWRLATEQHRTLLPPSIPCINIGEGLYLSIVDGKMRRFATPSGRLLDASFGSWLLDEHQGSIGCSLLDPLSPSTQAIQVPCRYDYYDQRTMKRFATSRLPGDCGRCDVVYPIGRPFPLKKIIVLSPHLVVGIFQGCPFKAAPVNFAIFRPGSTRWSHPAHNSRFRNHAILDSIYKDIEFHRGKIFAVDGAGHLFAHELVPGKEPCLGHCEDVIKEGPDATIGKNPCYRLVTSCDKQKLLMVRWSIPNVMDGVKIDRHLISLHVFEADLAKGRWSEVKDLGSQVLFIGTTGSRALAVTGSSDSNHHIFQGGNRVFILGNDFARAWAWRYVKVPDCKCLECRKLVNGIPDYCVYDMTSEKTSLASIAKGSSSMKYFRLEWFYPSV
ncbi:unnamed protein product [Alopecurus aequalis]